MAQDRTGPGFGPVQDAYDVERRAFRIRDLEEDPDAPDDDLVLVAGVLYDANTGEEVPS